MKYLKHEIINVIEKKNYNLDEEKDLVNFSLDIAKLVGDKCGFSVDSLIKDTEFNIQVEKIIKFLFWDQFGIDIEAFIEDKGIEGNTNLIEYFELDEPKLLGLASSDFQKAVNKTRNKFQLNPNSFNFENLNDAMIDGYNAVVELIEMNLKKDTNHEMY